MKKIMVIVVMLASLAVASLAVAKEVDQPVNHLYDGLINVLLLEVGFDTPYFDTGDGISVFVEWESGFYDDFQLWEDGSFRYMQFSGCLQGAYCDDNDLEVVDCKQVALGVNTSFDNLKQYDGTRQTDYKCTISQYQPWNPETEDSNGWLDLTGKVAVINLSKSYDTEIPVLEIDLYQNGYRMESYFPVIMK